MGSYPKQISSYIRPNHVFTSFKRNVLTCLQTKNLKPLSHSYDELKKKKKKKKKISCATSDAILHDKKHEIEMQYTCLEKSTPQQP